MFTLFGDVSVIDGGSLGTTTSTPSPFSSFVTFIPTLGFSDISDMLDSIMKVSERKEHSKNVQFHRENGRKIVERVPHCNNDDESFCSSTKEEVRIRRSLLVVVTSPDCHQMTTAGSPFSPEKIGRDTEEMNNNDQENQRRSIDMTIDVKRQRFPYCILWSPLPVSYNQYFYV